MTRRKPTCRTRVTAIADPVRLNPQHWCRVYVDAFDLAGGRHDYVLVQRPDVARLGIAPYVTVEVIHRHGMPQITHVIAERRRRTDAPAASEETQP